MAPLIALVSGFILARGLGLAGVDWLADSGHALRAALSAMFLLTASAHWGRMRGDLVRMVPTGFPRPDLVITVTGVLEILGAIGLLLPDLYRVAAISLALLLVAMFPANVRAARAGIPLRGRPPTPLALRTVLQLVFIGALVVAAL